jgi:LacI family transcriptional regulator
MNSKDRPDAIFASVEKLAIATYHVCHELNVQIPNDLKVLSYSNLNIAALLYPSLTTISQPAFEIGREAASILIRLIEKKHLDDLTNKVIIKSSLIVRDSTK